MGFEAHEETEFSVAIPSQVGQRKNGALGNIYLALLVSLYTKRSHEGCKIGGGDVEVVPGVNGDCFQLCFTRFLGGPIGGIC